jgi:predicted amidophosphoribosyltransferase
MVRALERRRATPAQQGLTRAARERNLTRAFRCVQPVSGLHLALIDDVMTTGSTARLASRVLRDAGATRVDVWVLARTPTTKVS